MNVHKQEKGFTIIEVVLVLAIAGLIFLMVFIALPALQRNQRDTARKNDMSIISAAITSAKSANRGTYPTGAELKRYLDNLSDNTKVDNVARRTDSGNTITLSQAQMEEGRVWWQTGKKCGNVGPDGSITLTSGSTAQFVVFGRLENGGTGYCVES